MSKWTRDQMAARVARDIAEGMVRAAYRAS